MSKTIVKQRGIPTSNDQNLIQELKEIEEKVEEINDNKLSKPSSPPLLSRPPSKSLSPSPSPKSPLIINGGSRKTKKNKKITKRKRNTRRRNNKKRNNKTKRKNNIKNRKLKKKRKTRKNKK